jgi:hypothetical protein
VLPVADGGGGPGPADRMKELAIANEKKSAGLKSPSEAPAASPGFGIAQLATAAAWAPDPENPPLYLDLLTKDGVPVPEVQAKFEANSPLALVDQYIGNVKQYRTISMDVGDQDGLRVDAGKLHEIIDKCGIARTPVPLTIDFRITYYHSSARICASSPAVTRQRAQEK